MPEAGEKRRSDQQHDAVAPNGWHWRQGDVLLRLKSFVRKTVSAQGELEIEDVPTDGAVVITQTCDLVRASDRIPNVELAALHRLDGVIAHEARGLRRPAYVHVPGAGEDAFAYLGLLMTVDKQALLRLEPIRGCRDEPESTRFAEGLVRRWSRFAFPNDVVEILRPLKERLDEKAKKGSPEGAAIRLIDYIFVAADPDWETAAGLITLHFVLPEDTTDVEVKALSAELTKWRPRLGAGARRLEVSVVKLSEVSAVEYLSWRRLDYDFISP